MKIKEKTRNFLIFVFLILGFPFFYIFLPMIVAFIINVVLVVILSYKYWKVDKMLVFLGLIFLTLQSFWLVRTIQTMQLLFIDIVEIARFQTIAMMITTFLYYLPWIIIFMIGYAVIYVYALFVGGMQALGKYAKTLGYIGVFGLILLVYIDLNYISPQLTELPKEFQQISINLFGNPIAFTLEFYYFVQFSIWIVSGWMFFSQMLGLILGERG